MNNHSQYIKKLFIKGAERYLSRISKDKNDPSYLTWSAAWNGMREADCYGSSISYPIILYYLEGSQYYHDASVLKISMDALDLYEKYVHDDGTVDLRITNYHDPAQTAFNIESDFTCIQLIDKFSLHTKEEDELFIKMKKSLKKGADAITLCGFHTPNHRWAICSALALANKYIPDNRYTDYMNGFFSEGIDCTKDGEYTERSAGHYNNICNQAFIDLALITGDKSFYEYPERNLKLMLSFVEPDYTVNSLNSTRVDVGQTHLFDEYYPYYYYMSLVTENAEFAYTADEMLERLKTGAASPCYALESIVLWIMLSQELVDKEKTIIPVKPRDDRSVYLPDSGSARIYLPGHNATVSVYRGHTPVFLKFQKGKNSLYFRLAGSFFGDPHSQFRPTYMEKTEDGFILRSEEHAGYRSQFDVPPETSDWRKMDHSKRRWINVQSLYTEVRIRIADDKITLDLNASGCEAVPMKLEIITDAGGKVVTSDMVSFARAGDYFFCRSEMKYLYGDCSSFDISGGFAEHYYAEDMRGSAPVDRSKVTFAMTDSTPFSRSVTVKITEKNNM